MGRNDELDGDSVGEAKGEEWLDDAGDVDALDVLDVIDVVDVVDVREIDDNTTDTLEEVRVEGFEQD